MHEALNSPSRGRFEMNRGLWSSGQLAHASQALCFAESVLPSSQGNLLLPSGLFGIDQACTTVGAES